MKTYLCFVDMSHKLHDEAKDGLALYLIWHVLYDKIWYKIETTTTSKEACNVLEVEYSERGRNNIF